MAYLLDTWSADKDTGMATIIDILRWRSIHQSVQVSYTFLSGGGKETAERLSYAELYRQVKNVGNLLRFAEGERALLFYPPGLNYIAAFLGCLHAGVIAVPLYPPRSSKHLLRIETILRDAQARFILTDKATMTTLRGQFLALFEHEDVEWILTDTLQEDAPDEWEGRGNHSQALAFLQYTSGSTSDPKGVMVTHANLLQNLHAIYERFEQGPASHGVIWLPPYHDMGLIGGILQPLYGGFPVTLMSPFAFLQNPLLWLKVISQTRATASGGPDFAYDLCVRKISPEQCQELDLSSWRLAFTGAEPIHHETLERFSTAFAPYGFCKEAFYASYGLAEATLMVSGGRCAQLSMPRTFHMPSLEMKRVVELPYNHTEGKLLVSCGEVIPGTEVRIVDPDSQIGCAPDQIGEVWIAGPGVAQGYWNLPVVSQQTFQATLAETGQKPFLRSGDLGFVHERELYIVGRLKDLIIIRGRNYYPQDIEQTVANCHPFVIAYAAAAFSVEVAGQEQLVLVQEVTRHARHQPLAPVVEAIRQSIAEQHELHTFDIILLKPGTLPKTSSGKIQRAACRQLYLHEELAMLWRSRDEHAALARPDAIKAADASLSRSELLVASHEIRDVLLRRYLLASIGQLPGNEHQQISDQQPLSTLGLDSLQALELGYAIDRDLAVSLPPEAFLQEQSIAELGATILATLSAEEQPQKQAIAWRVPDAGDYPLTPGQKALWFLGQLLPQSAGYNIARAMRIQAGLHYNILQQTFQQLLERHPILRTTFPLVHQEPVQRITTPDSLQILQTTITDWSQEKLEQHLTSEALRPFHLEEELPIRVGLYTYNQDEHILLLVFHHIAVDFWSLMMLIREFRTVYQALSKGEHSALAPLPLSYIDYTYQHLRWLEGPEGERARLYWLQQLAGVPTQLVLPYDHPHTLSPTSRGASHLLFLEHDLSEHLLASAQAQGCTLYVFLLTAFQMMLYHYTGQEEFLVGSPMSGRTSAELSSVCGYVANPVALRAILAGNPTFQTLLARTRTTVLEALAHQSYPFLSLVKQLPSARDAGLSPLFQVMFLMQRVQPYEDQELAALALEVPEEVLTLDEWHISSFPLLEEAAPFDLTLAVASVKGRQALKFQYNADLFDASTIKRMADYFLQLLPRLLAFPGKPLAELLVSGAEEWQLLADWNGTEVPYAESAGIHTLFEMQAGRTPRDIALLDGTREMTYAELNQRANQLGHYLRKLGVNSEVRVGVSMSRSCELIISLLAILKAGGVYVPLDPTYPQERLCFMLNDSKAPFLLIDDDNAGVFAENGNIHIINVYTCFTSISHESEQNVPATTTLDNAAYVLYTSGSTGTPKGVIGLHRGIVNRCFWMEKEAPFLPGEVCCQKTSLNFVDSVWEIFGPLINGIPTVLVAEHILKNMDLLVELLAMRKITRLVLVPSLLRTLLATHPSLEKALPELTWWICSGEALPAELCQRFFQAVPSGKLLNLYGSSEVAADATYTCILDTPVTSYAPLGRPLANTRIYLFDPYGQPVPVGVPGEIYIGGAGLARGYFNRPDLTAERFLPDPCASVPGERLFRTGDRARYSSDGVLEYLGRLDHQVKIRGVRVETGEVETRLVQHPAITEAVVLGYPALHADGQVELAAYIHCPGEQPAVSTLRAFLQHYLPDSMLPTSFTFLEAFPLLPNGKVDRKQLPKPQPAMPRKVSEGQIRFQNEIERCITRVWCEVLGIAEVEGDQNFFDLGGHSLLMIQIQYRLKQELNQEISMIDLLLYPTIQRLTNHIHQTRRLATVMSSTQVRAQLRQEALADQGWQIRTRVRGRK